MLKWLPSPIKGLLHLALIMLHTVILSSTLYVCYLIQWLIPSQSWHQFWSARCAYLGECWCYCNHLARILLMDVQWDIVSTVNLKRTHWYFIASNHQTWTDVMVLQHLFNRKIPLLKFFMKDVLKYLPFLGLVFLAFEYPILKRYSEKTLIKKPHLRGRDLKITLETCKRFQKRPSTLLSFVEGTRFTPSKHAQQNSPFKHLLKPKVGGFALTVKAMHERIDSFLHVTIVYPNKGTFWDYLCGRFNEAKIFIEEVKIPPTFAHGDYENDALFREEVRTFLYDLWARKDQTIENVLKASA